MTELGRAVPPTPSKRCPDLDNTAEPGLIPLDKERLAVLQCITACMCMARYVHVPCRAKVLATFQAPSPLLPTAVPLSQTLAAEFCAGCLLSLRWECVTQPLGLWLGCCVGAVCRSRCRSGPPTTVQTARVRTLVPDKGFEAHEAPQKKQRFSERRIKMQSNTRKECPFVI